MSDICTQCGERLSSHDPLKHYSSMLKQSLEIRGLGDLLTVQTEQDDFVQHCDPADLFEAQAMEAI